MISKKILKKSHQSRKEKKAHDHEHTQWSRRSFIQALGLAGGGSIILGGSAISATAPSPLAVALAESDNDNILVIIRLSGGNDGLNTIVPVYDYDTYANLRPTIKHHQSDLINLNGDFGIPNYMSDLESVWGEGSMKVIHGVGYQNQNLSHFTSTDIWASTADNYNEPTGWWGRYFEDLYPDYITTPPEIPPAIQIGSIGSLIFKGNNSSYAFSVANPDQLQTVAENGTLHDVLDIPDCVYGDKLLFMRTTANTTFTYSSIINDAYLAANNSVEYGEGNLALQLAMVARLIKGGLGSKVYMVTLGGFDTHAEQITRQQELLSDLSSTIKNFYDDLTSVGMDDKVLSMTISEFGRRPYENGSNGTDHGAASPLMLFGPALNGNGFIGNHPDLSTWDENDNLIPSNDFRSVYNTVLTDWFCLDPSIVNTILLNESYENLDLGLSCETLSNSNFNNTQRLAHVATYQNNQTYIEIQLPSTAHITIKLYDIMAKEIGTITNKLLQKGRHRFNIREELQNKLSYGQYIYRISTGGQSYSNSVLIK